MTRIPPRNPNEPERRTDPGTTAGVLDTIADGMTLVLQRPWLMIVPLVVDLAVWLLLKVRLTPMTDSARKSSPSSTSRTATWSTRGLRPAREPPVQLL